MAGGVGSRFWPKSRNHFPKQFIDILGTGKSLLQQTFERFTSFTGVENICVITNNDYAQLVADQIPEIPAQNIICEPSRNNTAPCIAYAAFKLFKENPEAVMVIVPSDHLILKEQEYLKIINEGVAFAKNNNALLTLGIQPTRPDTGYGYIQFENGTDKTRVKKVMEFKEKPNLETAQQYLASGNYLWNAGMFIWKASTIVECFKKLTPDIYQLFAQGQNYYNTSEEKSFIDQNYPQAPNISVDYAIIEKADELYTIPADIGWSDLGTWNSLHSVFESKDEAGNAVIANEAHLINTSNCMISIGGNKLAVIKQMDDFIIIDDQNVLLIYPKSEEQEIKGITEYLKNQLKQDYL